MRRSATIVVVLGVVLGACTSSQAPFRSEGRDADGVTDVHSGSDVLDGGLDSGADVGASGDVVQNGGDVVDLGDFQDRTEMADLGVQRCIARTGEQCRYHEDCCPGMPCTGMDLTSPSGGGANARCCRPVSSPCVTSEECCGSNCDHGVCSCNARELGVSRDCTRNSDCCGTGVACRTLGRAGECCGLGGSACSVHRDCCGLNCREGVCCLDQTGGQCDTSADCCVGLFCNRPASGGRFARCCNISQQTCRSRDDCCDRLSCVGGRCCSGHLEACSRNEDCCNNECVGGQCRCEETNTACTSATNCCAGGCQGGRCCAMPTFSCRVDGECCGELSVCVFGFCCRGVGGECSRGSDCCSSRCVSGRCEL